LEKVLVKFHKENKGVMMKYSNTQSTDNSNYLNGSPVGNSKSMVNAGDKIKNIICFSHLRWDFVFQRPQHLLMRWSKEARVFYFEEPVFGMFESNYISTVYGEADPNVIILTPHITQGSTEEQVNIFLEDSVNIVIRWNNIYDYLLWYITPMAMPFTSHLHPKIVVYDCMDELSHFKGAHPDMAKNEALLFRFADVVFTGGNSLYEYKKDRHVNMHPFASSIDRKHFESGAGSEDPADQKNIGHPRAGFFGVIDERLDIQLLDGIARALPDFQFIMVGPVVKIDPASLPVHKNIHYLGQKGYAELPQYLAHWDVAFLPFARNDSTRFISPTKTPEYLCAGKPVVSTSIRDVVNPYGLIGLVHIADDIRDFSRAIRKAMKQKGNTRWQREVRDFLKTNSWDMTWARMKKIILDTLEIKESLAAKYAPMKIFESNGISTPR
jgi:UDP-galactopyranose mutase